MGLWPVMAVAQDKVVRLYAPSGLIETGLIKFITPRFSLKTQVRVTLQDTAEGADIVLGDDGRAVFEGAGQVWHMQVNSPDHPGTKKLVSWIGSKVGKNTIFGFAPDGTALFAAPSAAPVKVVALEVSGDVDLGLKVSRTKCTRCHAVDETTRFSGIGSTPSFMVLRTFEDWEERFSSFYILKPHGAFTLIEGVSDPFPDDRPSPISPITLTLDEVEALMAYVAVMKAADLGKPLDHQ